ncbi:MAG: helix-turn-helix domain-containing protein [Pontimonas sp.]
MGTKITEEDMPRVVELREAGSSLADIAERYGCSRQLVCKKLKTYREHGTLKVPGLRKREDAIREEKENCSSYDSKREREVMRRRLRMILDKVRSGEIVI